MNTEYILEVEEIWETFFNLPSSYSHFFLWVYVWCSSRSIFKLLCHPLAVSSPTHLTFKIFQYIICQWNNYFGHHFSPFSCIQFLPKVYLGHPRCTHPSYMAKPSNLCLYGSDHFSPLPVLCSYTSLICQMKHMLYFKILVLIANLRFYLCQY